MRASMPGPSGRVAWQSNVLFPGSSACDAETAHVNSKAVCVCV